MTYLPGHDEKVTSDKKMISISQKGYNSRNRDYCSHFLVTFETTGKFLIVFVRLILGIVGFDVFTQLPRESDIRYEFELKILLKGLECQQRFFDPFLTERLSNN